MLPATLAALGPVDEIVVADGGSEDTTALTAHQAGARVVVTARGRGQQLAAGVAAVQQVRRNGHDDAHQSVKTRYPFHGLSALTSCVTAVICWPASRFATVRESSLPT